jgi:hypothetical protein
MTTEQPTLAIRPATPNDIPLIAFHRRAMFEDMGVNEMRILLSPPA